MKTVKGKKLSKENWIILIFILIAVIASVAGWFSAVRQGVYVNWRFYHKTFGDRFLYNSDNYIRWKTDHEFEIVEDGKKKTAFCYVEGYNIRVQFDDEEIDGSWDSQMQYIYITGEDGNVVGIGDFQTDYDDSEPGISNSVYANAIARIAYHDTERRSYRIYIISGWILYVAGAAGILYPDQSVFFLRRRLYAEELELSDFGRFMARLSGVLCMGTGIVLMSGLYLVFMNR